ncbi:response regulator transcription factor [Phenylobacterium aquaticum]|uniref:response regulator transcription factor n=1 Tax=Phenylobacterium aquaticum TaxID=1763816 RepID=UPI001F5DB195|nr:response regulator [Phenylobacterium aquaticum]MCI3134585.1 response regulator [Phenylobacterium aquaticum]
MSATASSTRRRILVVDDEPMVLELITTRLELAGYEAYYARNGREGLARLAELRPAALILDINMPELDGFGVMLEMAQSGMILSTPTMVLTARNQTSDIRHAMTLGARDFLAKPFRDDQLLARVARLMRSHRPRPPLLGTGAGGKV